MMFIKYSPKIPHTKVIPLVPMKGEVAPDNDTVMLRPGTNEISDVEWNIIQPHIKNLIGKEIIVFSVPVKDGSKAKQAKTLKDVPVATARKIIEGCQDPKTLKKWFNQELPDELLLVLSKRMRKLKVEPDDIGDDDDLALKDTDITDEGKTQPEIKSDTTDDDIEDDDAEDDDGEAGGDDEELTDDDDDIPDFDGSRSGGTEGT
jgi:hypothetical protein